jgi:hypothetical protein
MSGNNAPPPPDDRSNPSAKDPELTDASMEGIEQENRPIHPSEEQNNDSANPSTMAFNVLYDGDDPTQTAKKIRTQTLDLPAQHDNPSIHPLDGMTPLAIEVRNRPERLIQDPLGTLRILLADMDTWIGYGQNADHVVTFGRDHIEAYKQVISNALDYMMSKAAGTDTAMLQIHNSMTQLHEGVTNLNVALQEQRTENRQTASSIQQLQTRTSTSWAEVASRPAQPAQQNQRDRKKLVANSLHERSITIQLMPEDKDEFSRKGEAATISQVYAAILEDSELEDINIEAVTILPSQDIRIILATQEQANLVRERENYWLIPFHKYASLLPPPLLYGVIMHSVPADWDCSDLTTDLSEDYPQADIRQLQWLTKDRENKRHGSMIVYCHSAHGRDYLLNKGGMGLLNHFMPINAEYQGPSKPPQCFKCQKHGHVAKHCLAEAICALCACKHRTSTCPLNKKNNPNVDDNMLKCANCGGNHPSFHGTCSSFKDAKAKFNGNKPNSSHKQRDGKKSGTGNAQKGNPSSDTPASGSNAIVPKSKNANANKNSAAESPGSTSKNNPKTAPKNNPKTSSKRTVLTRPTRQ